MVLLFLMKSVLRNVLVEGDLLPEQFTASDPIWCWRQTKGFLCSPQPDYFVKINWQLLQRRALL